MECRGNVEGVRGSFPFTVGSHTLFDELEGPAGDMIGAADGEAGAGS